jgi:hypothetical protein
MPLSTGSPVWLVRCTLARTRRGFAQRAEPTERNRLAVISGWSTPTTMPAHAPA